MARKVFISSDMSSDEAISEVAEIDQVAGLMWPWILTYFDDWGRAKASPREIKNSVFQANDLITVDTIKKALNLYSNRLLKIYEVKGKTYMSIEAEKWFKYQTHIRREKRDNDGSKIPPPDDNGARVREDARDNAQISDNLTNCIPSPSPSPSPSLKDTTTRGDDMIQILNAYCDIHNRADIHIKPVERSAMEHLSESGIPIDFIISSMKTLHAKKIKDGEKVTSFLYYPDAITDAWKRKTTVVEFKPHKQSYPVAVGQAISNIDETNDIISEMERLKEEKRKRLAASGGEDL